MKKNFNNDAGRVRDWEAILVAAGFRITEPRRAVIEALAQAGRPLLPEELLERVQLASARVGLVTVYRALSLFTRLQLVRRVHGEDGCHGYMLASPGHTHAIVCQHCGQTAEFSGEDDLNTVIERAQAQTGYRVSGHMLQLFGVCPDCEHVACK